MNGLPEWRKLQMRRESDQDDRTLLLGLLPIGILACAVSIAASVAQAL